MYSVVQSEQKVSVHLMTTIRGGLSSTRGLGPTMTAGPRPDHDRAGPRPDHDREGPEYRYLDWYATANTDYV
jgi:hypothetical protein